MLRFNRLNTKPFFKAIKMKTSNFDLKKNETPIDSTARKVVYSTGFYEEYKNPSSQKLSKTPLPTMEIPSDVEDLTGTIKGSLTCIGLYGGFEVGKREKGKNRSKPSGHGWAS